ncbi:MAG: cyclic peptide export ABC transporter, partial [Chitinophagaceae bacterium]
GNMAVIFIVNNILRGFFSNNPTPSDSYAWFFGAAILVFFISRWLVSSSIISFTQDTLRKLRLEILGMLLQSAYYPLVKNKERIHTALTRDASNVVQASISMVDIMTNIIIAIICFIYMAVLSWKLLVCMLILLAFTIVIYAISEKKGYILFNKAMGHDDRFVKYLNEILAGFKEIVIERKKGTDIEEKHIVKEIDSSVALNKKALVNFLNNRVMGQLAFYVFIGLLLLYLGKTLDISNGTMVSFIFLVLYIFGPIETVVILIPGLSQAKTSLKRLTSLKDDLREIEPENIQSSATSSFDSLVIKDMFYEYSPTTADEKPFSVGPVDFQVSKGKVVFICGGNGSGKTTFINLLVGLFPYDKGEIYLNDNRVDDPRSYTYRSLFAPVFSDFHLFDECYSIENIDTVKVNEYLRMFDLDSKISFVDNKFTSVDLSTGQRKRLALICAMLEKKPIIVMDEFGADQDPHFRKKFYSHILDYMKQEGFTVIAITHDDNYYSYCDYIYKMDYGKIELMDLNEPATHYPLATSH